jgi:conjugal transfer pilus assembly protein TraL
MQPVPLPRDVDDAEVMLLWSADEAIPFLVIFVIGFTLDQLLVAVAVGAIFVKLFRKYKDAKPDGFLLHATYWLGLVPIRHRTVGNPFVREYYQ